LPTEERPVELRQGVIEREQQVQVPGHQGSVLGLT